MIKHWENLGGMEDQMKSEWTVENIYDSQVKVIVGKVWFTCEKWEFEDKSTLVGMLMQCEGEFPEENAEKIASYLLGKYIRLQFIGGLVAASPPMTKGRNDK